MISEGCNYNCYENKDNYVIHIPDYHFRIIGPKKSYSYSFDNNEDAKLYIIKTVDNDFDINELFEKYTIISAIDYHSIIIKWISILNLFKS